jgi:hypothetical protein
MNALIVPILLSAAICSPKGIPASRHLSPAAADAALARTSSRALRRAQIIMRLRLDELREADFARVRAVIERRLSVDSLLATPEPKGASSETSCRPIHTTG